MVLDRTIHGSLAVAVNSTAPVPRLNTSINRRCWAMELNLGRTGSPEAPGQAEALFSTATPRVGTLVGATSVSRIWLMLGVRGSDHVV